MGNRHLERHRLSRVGWLRAAVLGANDGIVSTASLVIGVAAAEAGTRGILVAGVAGLVAGAMSMAAGEYVSVYSQADSEAADLARERQEIASDPDSELAELTGIYLARGLDPVLAKQVAVQLSTHDVVGAHARDELGLSETIKARPLQAAGASALAFSAGAALPLVVVVAAPAQNLIGWLFASSLLCLAALGCVAAWAGGAPMARSALRITFWGAAAMALTAGVGALFGVSTA